MHELAQNFTGFVTAWKQVAQAGTPAQRARATEVVDEARKALYRVLVED